MTVGRLTQLILECHDAERLARFWQEVLTSQSLKVIPSG